MTKGKLFGLSLGPGDPQLITRRAWDCLQRSDAVWTYPIRTKQHDSYALDIALRAGLSLPAQHQPLIFPMTHDVEKLARYWANAAQAVLNHLHQGRDVMFLVEGDASTYSTFTHLSRTVRALDEEIAIETVPGVTSFHAAAAHVQIPLADVDDTVAVIPAGYGIDMIDKLLREFDTLVLLKVKPLLDDILHLLQQRELLDSSYFVEKAGSPEERVVHDLAALRGQSVNYLSLIIVRSHHRERGEMVRGCKNKSTIASEP